MYARCGPGLPVAATTAMANRPPRLCDFPYTGLHRYFLTGSTYRRQRAFSCASFAAVAQAHLLRCAAPCGFVVLAYCLMPDHVHALVEGRDTQADLRAYWRRFRQHTGFAWRRLRGQKLWTEGYFDRVLRDDEDSLGVAAY